MYVPLLQNDHHDLVFPKPFQPLAMRSMSLSHELVFCVNRLLQPTIYDGVAEVASRRGTNVRRFKSRAARIGHSEMAEHRVLILPAAKRIEAQIALFPASQCR